MANQKELFGFAANNTLVPIERIEQVRKIYNDLSVALHQSITRNLKVGDDLSIVIDACINVILITHIYLSGKMIDRETLNQTIDNLFNYVEERIEQILQQRQDTRRHSGNNSTQEN